MVRHPLPAHLEIETITIEPELSVCPACGKLPCRIGEEVSEEIDLVPAHLVRRRTVRPKYACPCGEAGVAVAPLPPRLIPQSKLGLGLAVHMVLARFDDHLSFYRLEQQFRERHNVIIPRPQMVQWNVHSAEGWEELLLPEIERQQGMGKEVAFRGDAAFAKPEVYKALEEGGVKYAIRIPANESLEREIAELLPRPVGRPSQKPWIEYKEGFLYQAASWKTTRRVGAKVVANHATYELAVLAIEITDPNLPT